MGRSRRASRWIRVVVAFGCTTEEEVHGRGVSRNTGRHARASQQRKGGCGPAAASPGNMLDVPILHLTPDLLSETRPEECPLFF